VQQNPRWACRAANQTRRHCRAGRDVDPRKDSTTPELSNWREQSRAHWKQFRPSLCCDLKRSGKLEATLTDAAERTQREMAQLERAGFYTHEAWEIVRESYLFPPEEGKAWLHSDSLFLICRTCPASPVRANASARARDIRRLPKLSAPCAASCKARTPHRTSFCKRIFGCRSARMLRKPLHHWYRECRLL
jgi:hypothetical protein